MKTFKIYGFLLSGTIISGLFSSLAHAADLEQWQRPAVSDVNGKVELGGGYSSLNNFNSDGLFYGQGSISVPLGNAFGFQGDFAVINQFDSTLVGGAGHLFTRDPSSYLFGAIGGYSSRGDINASWGGAEAELYLDRVTLAASGGYMHLNPLNAASFDRAFGTIDLKYYATDNVALNVGASSIAGLSTAGAGVEWMMQDVPVSLKLDGRVGENGYATASAGISFYFGGNESNKSLIRRHREDDPDNAVKKITQGIGAAAASTGGSGSPCQSTDNEAPNYCSPD